MADILLRKRRQGAEAERQVARILNRLPPDKYIVFHNIKARYGNIDHLVVSKTGTFFLIETKSHRGKIKCRKDSILLNGKNLHADFIAQVSRNIAWLRSFVKKELDVDVWIVAVIVFSEAFVYVPKGKTAKPQSIKNIHIINKAYLRKFIESYPAKRPCAVLWDKAQILQDLVR